MAGDDSPPEGETQGDGRGATGQHRSRHRRRWLIATGVLGLVVLLGVGAVMVGFLLRSQPKPKSVDEAVEGFRATTTVTAAEPTGLRRPHEGVYELTGGGSASISFPPADQHDGAVMPGSVTYLPDGCWRWRVDYNQAHWQEYDLCPRGPDLLLVAQHAYQAWDLGAAKLENSANYTCDPPSPVLVVGSQEGASFDHTCSGTNSAVAGQSTAAGPGVVVGTETVAVGAAQVPAIHIARHSALSGPQSGTVNEEWWFATDTGLPLRSQRDVVLDTSSPVGTITYREQGSWQMASLVPRT